jgi:hypothetical protein
LALSLLSLSSGCNSTGGGGGGGGFQTQDMAMPGDDKDMASGKDEDMTGTPRDMSGGDLAGADLASPPGDMSMGGSGLPCTPGSYRCGPANSVQICNSTGSAWLHTSTCAVACVAGLCTGACSPGEKRCNMKSVEQCNGAGTTWTPVETCTGSCSSGRCALANLDVTMNRSLDGEIYVDGDFIVRSGITVQVPSGDLTVYAKNITIENMGTINAVPRGNPYGWGSGGRGPYDYSGGAGGGNGTSGSPGTGGGTGGSAINSNTDFWVVGGGNGGTPTRVGSGSGGIGGGAVRLIASESITMAGFLTANGTSGNRYSSGQGGGGGGGAGGGILLAASGNLTVTGNISTLGGSGGGGYYSDGQGGAGGIGRVRLLAGGTRSIGGSISGQRTDGLLPPTTITSSSHPDQDLIYNDDFDQVQMSWVSPFASRQGYYQMLNTNVWQVPTPATSKFVNTESVNFPANATRSGLNYFHITPVDAMSNVGTVENTFRIQINTQPPSLSSSSHSSATSWYDNPDVFFEWGFPVADSNVKGIYYVLDNYGDTIPTKAATFVPLPQKKILRSMVSNGIWVMHVLAMDQQGYLTKAATHLRVNVGPNPGVGGALGLVTDSTSKPLSGATVTLNRGLYSQATNSSGNYNITGISAGSYELKVSHGGKTATQMITITKDMTTTANISIP